MKKDAVTWASMFLIITITSIYVGLGMSEFSLAYIVSGSMEPTYYRGDLIIMKKVSAGEVAIGDVIIFKSPSNPRILILHRVVGIKFSDGKYYFLTKGDNPETNNNIDPWGWVPEEYLIGKLIYRIPFLGSIAEILNISYIRYILIILVAFLLILSLMEHEEEKTTFSFDMSVKSNDLKTILVLGIICLISVSFLIGITNPKYRVLIRRITYQKAYDLELNVNITYISLTMLVESNGYWISSIKKIYLEFYINSNSNDQPVGRTIWSISYNFHGTKEISLCMVLDESSWMMLISGNYEKAYIKVEIIAVSLIKGQSEQVVLINL